MDPPAGFGGEGGGAPSSAPPVGGLGNYKGVMLCNRPPDDSTKQLGLASGGAKPAFKTTVSPVENEALGLCPVKPQRQPNPGAEVKNRGSSAALRRHCRWLKELQGQVQQSQQHAQDSADKQVERDAKMREAFKARRDVVLQQVKSQQEAGQLDKEGLARVMGNLGVRKGAAPGGKRKPMWAMTEAEKEDAEEADADELIKFAEELDFDSYLGDLEFRQCLQAIRDRAKKLQREQDSFKASLVGEFNAAAEDSDSGGGEPEQGGSTSGARGPRRARVGSDVASRPDWDASTACGDAAAAEGDPAAQSIASRAMESSSQMRAIHSKVSMQRLVKTAKGSQQGSEGPAA